MKRNKSKEKSRNLKGPVKVVLLPEAEEGYKKIKKWTDSPDCPEEVPSFELLKRTLDFIRSDPYYGREITGNFLKQYKVQNLFVVKLTEIWSLLYTIRNSNVEVICFMVD